MIILSFLTGATFCLSVGTEIDFPAMQQNNYQMMALLVSAKSEASEIAKHMFTSPGVNFALVSDISVRGHTAHAVSIRVESDRIRELWVWLWEEKKAWLSGHGLQAIVLQSGTVAWLDGNAGEWVGQWKWLKYFTGRCGWSKR